MNCITRRIRELKTGRVKVRRLSMYPHDADLKIRPRYIKGYKQLKSR